MKKILKQTSLNVRIEHDFYDKGMNETKFKYV